MKEETKNIYLEINKTFFEYVNKLLNKYFTDESYDPFNFFRFQKDMQELYEDYELAYYELDLKLINEDSFYDLLNESIDEEINKKDSSTPMLKEKIKEKNGLQEKLLEQPSESDGDNVSEKTETQ